MQPITSEGAGYLVGEPKIERIALRDESWNPACSLDQYKWRQHSAASNDQLRIRDGGKPNGRGDWGRDRLSTTQLNTIGIVVRRNQEDELWN
jgi:hypothetical protein